MPTILRQAGFSVKVFPNDHAPAHVHVWRSGQMVLINLGDEQTAPHVRENRGMRFVDERRALQVVAENQDELLAAWRRIHG